MKRLYSMIALIALALLLAAPAVIADEGVPGGGGGTDPGGPHRPPDDGGGGGEEPECPEEVGPCELWPDELFSPPPADPVDVSDWSLVRMFLDLAATIF